MVTTDSENEAYMQLDGVVRENLGNGLFVVYLENEVDIQAHVCGRIRRNFIKVLINDRVSVELSTYDLDKGRIVYRYKKDQPSIIKKDPSSPF